VLNYRPALRKLAETIPYTLTPTRGENQTFNKHDVSEYLKTTFKEDILMKTKLIATTIATALVAIISAHAYAQTPTPVAPRADAREVKQQQRIDQGVASGQLNANETRKLENGQARVDATEARAKADGKVTRKERAKLEVMQDKQSRKIYRQKHDAQKSKTVTPPPAITAQ
jgi:hypothetical protein